MASDTGITQKKRKRAKQLLEPAPSQDVAHDNKLVRALGSVDWHTRESGVLAITALLSQSNDLAEDQLMKIWKGIHFAFWHSDKTPVQMELAERLAKIGNQIKPELGLKYFKTFLLTMRREWGKIDHLRLDKYLSLVRKFMRELCTFLARSDWEPEVVKDVGGFLLGEIMVPQSAQPALGLTLHISQVAAEEMCVAWEGNPPPSSAWPAILEPYCRSLAFTNHPGVLHRLCDAVFGRLLRSRAEAGDGPQSAVANLDAGGLGDILFDLGAQPKVRAVNRGELYSLSSQFQALGRRLRKGNADGPLQPLSNGGQEQAGGPGSGGNADSAGQRGASDATASPSSGSENASKGISSASRREKKDRKRQEGEAPSQPAAPAGTSDPMCETSLGSPSSGKAAVHSPPSGKAAVHPPPSGKVGLLSPPSVEVRSPTKEKRQQHKRLKTMQPCSAMVLGEEFGEGSLSGEKQEGGKTPQEEVGAREDGSTYSLEDCTGLRGGNNSDLDHVGAHVGGDGSCLSGKKLRKKLGLLQQQPEEAGGKLTGDGGNLAVPPSAEELVMGDVGNCEGAVHSAVQPAVQSVGLSAKKQKKLQRQLFLDGSKEAEQGATPQPLASALRPKKLLVKLRHKRELSIPNSIAQDLVDSLGSPLSPEVGAKTAPPVVRPGRKHVRWSLDQNLYHEKGAPVPPAEIRTPPTAKPKGSALKQQASCRSSLKFLSPESVPRARAGSFF